MPPLPYLPRFNQNPLLDLLHKENHIVTSPPSGWSEERQTRNSLDGGPNVFNTKHD